MSIEGDNMRKSKVLGVALAVTAFACAFTAPAMGDALGGKPGQPVVSGNATGAMQLHCQSAAEVFLGADLPAGTAPGVIVLLPSGKYKVTGPPNGVCEEIAAQLGL